MTSIDSAGPPSNDAVLSLQRQANETLLLRAMEARDEADKAAEEKASSEREASAAKLREDELRSTAEFRERLIAIIGHDLRNPLQAVLMSADALGERDYLTAGDARLVRLVTKSAARMEAIIGQLVDFTRARLGGGFVLNVSSSNLGDICRDVAEELGASNPVEIRRTTDGDVSGQWDASRLATALSNILGNALDHALPGTPVILHTHEDGEGVVAEITNEGACIPPSLLPVIFLPFRRASSASVAPSAHLGLGLYVACEITRAHGGTLGVRSTSGSTTFRLRLPRTVDATVDATVNAA